MELDEPSGFSLAASIIRDAEASFLPTLYTFGASTCLAKLFDGTLTDAAASTNDNGD